MILNQEMLFFKQCIYSDNKETKTMAIEMINRDDVIPRAKLMFLRMLKIREKQSYSSERCLHIATFKLLSSIANENLLKKTIKLKKNGLRQVATKSNI